MTRADGTTWGRHLRSWWPRAAADGSRGGELAEDARVRSERFIAVIRLAVVVASAALLVGGTGSVRTYPTLAWGVVGVAVLYGAGMARWPMLTRPRLWALCSTVFDGLLVAGYVAATGGVHSVGVAILPLVVISGALRFDRRLSVLVSAATGGAYLLTILVVDRPPAPLAVRLQTGLWWLLFLVLGGLLAAFLSGLFHQQRAAVRLAAEDARREHEHRLRLEDLDRQHEELLSVVVHEFRTPLCSLGALVRQVGSGALAGREDQALPLIDGHVQHLATMVESLGQVVGSHDPRTWDRVELLDTDVVEVVRGAAAAAGDVAGRVGIEVLPSLRRVSLDPVKFRRIVTNLVENALRHNGPAAEVQVKVGAEDEKLCIRVDDDGCGPPSWSAMATPGRPSPGSGGGLGLWIVGRLTEALGGTLTAAPRPGGGSSFRVVLPVAGPRLSEEWEARSRPPSPERTR